MRLAADDRSEPFPCQPGKRLIRVPFLISKLVAQPLRRQLVPVGVRAKHPHFQRMQIFYDSLNIHYNLLNGNFLRFYRFLRLW